MAEQKSEAFFRERAQSAVASSSARTWVASSFTDKILSSKDVRHVLASTAEHFGKTLQLSRCVVMCNDIPGLPSRPPVEWSCAIVDPEFDDVSLRVGYFIRDILQRNAESILVANKDSALHLEPIWGDLETLKIKSILAVPTTGRGQINGAIICYQCDRNRSWSNSDKELLEQFTLPVGIAIQQARESELSEIAFQPEPHFETIPKVLFDERGVILNCNKTFADLVGVLPSTIIGGKVGEIAALFPDRDIRERLLAMFSVERLRNGQKVILEGEIENKTRNVKLPVIAQFTYVNLPGSMALRIEAVFIQLPPKQNRVQVAEKSAERYKRLVEHSDAIIFNSTPDHKLTFVSKRALDFFGFPPEELTGSNSVTWYDLLHAEDKQRMERLLGKRENRLAAFDAECRVINNVTGKVRWILIRLVPEVNEKNELRGWDGFGIDITERKEAQEALDSQSKRVRALYSVSSAIRGHFELPVIASRGLEALCDATGAESGACYLFNQVNGKLELSASDGFTDGFDERSDVSGQLSKLVQFVARQGQSIVITDMRTDPRGSKSLAEDEGILSAVLVPIVAENETFGTIGLFSKNLARFDAGDIMLVGASANQIALAARQASLFSAYRRQTKSLASLYRISHELARNLSIEDVFQQAFTIIRDELGLKRVWLGLLNETKTKLIGQAAYGPGWKRRLVEVSVEIQGRDHPLAKVVNSRSALVIDSPEEVLRELGLRKVFSRLDIHSLALVPLLSSGEVIGVLAVQPRSGESTFDDEHVTLLTSLANEIAAVILNKRLETRVADSEKMRTAGLLAGGIAHNFNNLLQAIVGQASLLELQRGKDERILKAVQIINESATRGAELVKQLLSFAHLEAPIQEVCDVSEIGRQNRETFQRILGSRIKLNMSLQGNLPKIFADPRHILRIINALVTNAAQAIEGEGWVEISSDSINIDRLSVHTEIPPGRYLRLSVKDSGRGMDEQTKRRCFEPFFTTKNVDPGSGLSITGSGLGLAAAYALARRNGGKMTVESRLGEGTVFTVYLPIYSDKEENLTVQVSSSSPESQAEVALHENIEDSHHKVLNLQQGIEKTVLRPSPLKGRIRVLGDRGGSSNE